LVVAQPLDEPHRVVEAVGLVVARIPLRALEDHHVGHASLLPGSDGARERVAVLVDRPAGASNLSAYTPEDGRDGPPAGLGPRPGGVAPAAANRHTRAVVRDPEARRRAALAGHRGDAATARALLDHVDPAVRET